MQVESKKCDVVCDRKMLAMLNTARAKDCDESVVVIAAETWTLTKKESELL